MSYIENVFQIGVEVVCRLLLVYIYLYVFGKVIVWLCEVFVLELCLVIHIWSADTHFVVALEEQKGHMYFRQ